MRWSTVPNHRNRPDAFELPELEEQQCRGCHFVSGRLRLRSRPWEPLRWPAATPTRDTTVATTAPAQYLAGDFHNHTTCSDGSISMQKLVKKATDTVDTPWGLDWFVQAGHGGNGNRNCTLAEDATLSTPAYPFVEGKGPNTTWADSIGVAAVKGNTQSNPADAGNSTTPLSSQANPSMWRWQSIQEFQYPMIEYLSALRNEPLFIGLESVVAGHEHSSMSVITGQMPAGFDKRKLPTSPPFVAFGNATRIVAVGVLLRSRRYRHQPRRQQRRCDRQQLGLLDPASSGSTDTALGWNDNAQEALSTAAAPAPATRVTEDRRSDQVDGRVRNPRQLLRTGAPRARRPVQPGRQQRLQHRVPAQLQQRRAADRVRHGNAARPRRVGRAANTAAPQHLRHDATSTRSAAPPTAAPACTARRSAACGMRCSAKVATSGSSRAPTGTTAARSAPDDRHSSQDFYPGEYQRTYTLLHPDGKKKLTPQQIVDGLRTGNDFSSSVSSSIG